MADTENTQEVTDEGGLTPSEEQVPETQQPDNAEAEPAAQETETSAAAEDPPAADALAATDDAPAATEESPAAADDAPAAADDVTEDAPAATEATGGDGEEVAAGRESEEEAVGEEAKKQESEETKEGDNGETGEDKDEAQEATEQGEGPGEGTTEEEGEGKEDAAQDEGTEEKGEDEQPAEEQAATEAEGEQQQLESENFTEGERLESPVTVGEKLSREGTPSQEVPQDQTTQSPPVPSTPEPGFEAEQKLEEGEEESDYEEEDEVPQFDREMLIERYQQALGDRQQLQEQNHKLQHRLAEYFRKKKSDEVRQDFDKTVTDQEQRYLKYMANLDELRLEEAEEREHYQQHMELLSEKCEEKQELVKSERDKFMEHKKYTAIHAVNSRSGRAITTGEVEQYLANEIRKESEVAVIRLENIKLKNKLKKTESQLKSKEELAEGLHMIDFEQLKIENQTYNEKIEERNEELMKLRKKITMTVQVLTHLKEKLQFVQGENHIQKSRLHEVEDMAGKKRDILSRTKQARDALRIDNNKLRQNCGLLGNKSLLRDYEELKDGGDDLKGKLEYLKVLHAELTLNLNGVRRKLEEARANQQQ